MFELKKTIPAGKCDSYMRIAANESTLSYYTNARDGVVVRALASHQCGPDSNPRVDAICGLSLLLVLSFAPRGYSSGTPVFPSSQKPTFPNSNLTRNQACEEPLCGCVTSKSLQGVPKVRSSNFMHYNF